MKYKNWNLHLYRIFLFFICISFLVPVSCFKKKKWENPYEYNLKGFLSIDPELICYQELEAISLPFESPRAIAAAAGTIYVAGDEKLAIIKENGEITDILDLGNTVYALAAEGLDFLYIGYTDYVETINIKTNERHQWASLGNEAFITSLSVGNKYVFVADAGNHGVYCYTKEGTLVTRITKREQGEESYFIIPSPYFDIVGLPDDTFRIVNPGRHRLEHWTAKGEFLGQWGEPGSELGQFCGCCNPVHITLLLPEQGKEPGDMMFVTTEKGIPRIKLYTRTGEFVCVIASPVLFNEGSAGLDCAAGPGGKVYVLDPVKKGIRIFDKRSSPWGKLK